LSKPLLSSADARFAALWALAGVCEAPVLARMVGFPLPVGAFGGVLLHVAAAALMFVAPPREKGWFKPTRHWGEPLALIALLLPGLGWLACGWMVFFHGEAPFDKEAYRFEAEGEEDFNPVAASGSQPGRAELSEALDIVPAVDALLSRSSALRRGAVETLSRIRTPEAIGWLLDARGDADAELRFYATTALTRLKRDYETAAQAAEREAYQRPGELEPQLALQRVRLEYALSGLLDFAARNALLEECRERLAAHAARSAEALRLLFLVERRLDPSRALGRLDELERAEPERSGYWARERAELLFALGRYRELRALIRERGAGLVAATGRAEDEKWASAALWWTG